MMTRRPWSELTGRHDLSGHDIRTIIATTRMKGMHKELQSSKMVEGVTFPRGHGLQLAIKHPARCDHYLAGSLLWDSYVNAKNAPSIVHTVLLHMQQKNALYCHLNLGVGVAETLMMKSILVDQ